MPSGHSNNPEATAAKRAAITAAKRTAAIKATHVTQATQDTPPKTVKTDVSRKTQGKQSPIMHRDTAEYPIVRELELKKAELQAAELRIRELEKELADTKDAATTATRYVTVVLDLVANQK